MPVIRKFAAPLVITAALAPGCGEEKDAPKAPPPTKPTSARLDAAPAASTLTWAPSPDHPDALVPSERTLTLAHSTIELDASLTCTEYFRDDCDPGVKCNPPEPRPVTPCPPELHPRAAPGALIYGREDRCFTLASIPVVCPAGGPTVVPPDPWEVGDTYFLIDDLACRKAGDLTLAKVECPDALLPTLQHDLKPDANDGGKCSYRGSRVKC